MHHRGREEGLDILSSQDDAVGLQRTGHGRDEVSERLGRLCHPVALGVCRVTEELREGQRPACLATQPRLDLVPVEVGRHATSMAQAAARARGVDRRVAEQVPVVDQLLDHMTLADKAEPEPGAHRDQSERRVGASRPEPQLLSCQRGHVVRDHDRDIGRFP